MRLVNLRLVWAQPPAFGSSSWPGGVDIGMGARGLVAKGIDIGVGGLGHARCDAFPGMKGTP